MSKTCLQKFCHISVTVVVCLNPSCLSISFRVKSLLCLATYPSTDAHASSMRLSSQWAMGKQSSVWPCCPAASSVKYVGLGLCWHTLFNNVFLCLCYHMGCCVHLAIFWCLPFCLLFLSVCLLFWYVALSRIITHLSGMFGRPLHEMLTIHLIMVVRGVRFGPKHQLCTLHPTLYTSCLYYNLFLSLSTGNLPSPLSITIKPHILIAMMCIHLCFIHVNSVLFSHRYLSIVCKYKCLCSSMPLLLYIFLPSFFL